MLNVISGSEEAPCTPAPFIVISLLGLPVVSTLSKAPSSKVTTAVVVLVVAYVA